MRRTDQPAEAERTGGGAVPLVGAVGGQAAGDRDESGLVDVGRLQGRGDKASRGEPGGFVGEEVPGLL
ncbi:hypothetical protein [Streptomyces sp. MCC20]|uniref:hypothetical protein n=1 Tax=Streptomyces sediminimaris TaxID=3383721 RepID=UPI00399BCA41